MHEDACLRVDEFATKLTDVIESTTRLIFLLRDHFQSSSVVTSQYSRFFLEKVSGKSPESCLRVRLYHIGYIE